MSNDSFDRLEFSLSSARLALNEIIEEFRNNVTVRPEVAAAMFELSYDLDSIINRKKGGMEPPKKGLAA